MSARRVVTLTRLEDTPWGVFGLLDTGSFHCVTLERPRVGDHPCIPAGEYDVDWTTEHPKHSPCYEVKNVPGRTDILIHTANVFEQLLGCIAPGLAVEEMKVEWRHDGEVQRAEHRGVSHSTAALTALIADLGAKKFQLVIKEDFHHG